MTCTGSEVKQVVDLIPRSTLAQNLFRMDVEIRLETGQSKVESVRLAATTRREMDSAFEPSLSLRFREQPFGTPS
jgi:hypothetical protein